MKHVKNSLLWIPTILWYRVIWSFSAQNSQVSGDLSDRLLWRLMSFLSPSFGIGYFQAQNTAVEMLSFF